MARPVQNQVSATISRSSQVITLIISLSKIEVIFVGNEA